MKTMSLWRWFLATLVSTVAVTAPAANVPSVRIQFDNPKYFSDIRIHDFNEFRSADIFAQEMTKALSPIVARTAPGYTLVLHFTDIDLGGRYEPWKPQHSQIRYSQQWMPIRMSFNYTLEDSKGRTVSQGTKSLVDTLFLGWSVGGEYWENWDYLYFEKRLLSRWVQQIVRTPNPGTEYSKG
jgi:hypothetical protein